MTLKKQTLLLFSSLLILALVATGCAPKEAPEETGDETSVAAEAVDAEIFYVKSEMTSMQPFDNQLMLPGKAEPIQSVVITAKTAGDVESAPFDIGDIVEKGTVLLTIDDQDHKIASSSAKLGLEQARIKLNTAKDDLDKNKVLFDSGAISKSQLDSLDDGYQQASIGYKTAQNNYQTAKINLENTTIESPISGIVSSKKVSIGENLNPGTPVFTVVNTDEISVIIGIPERSIHGVALDQEVLLTAQYGDDTWMGKVVNISPVMDDMSHTYTTKILVDNAEGRLRAGMSLDVSITMGSVEERLAVNKLALILEEDETFVYINDNGTAKMTAVTLGTSNDDYYEVINGLKLKDEVITEGSGMLENGDLIEIKN